MVKLTSVEETLAWGKAFAKKLQGGEVLALVGNLGAGKTHLTKGLVAGLESKAEVSSPTFTLIHEYLDGRLPIFHFDFYRMEKPEEVLALGWDDYFYESGIMIVEWADLFPELLPEGTHWIELKIENDGSRTLQER